MVNTRPQCEWTETDVNLTLNDRKRNEILCNVQEVTESIYKRKDNEP